MARKLNSKTKSVAATGSMPALSVVGGTDSMNYSSRCDRTGEEIARLAYSYWEARLRQRQTGSAEDDWRRAEQELTQQAEADSSAA